MSAMDLPADRAADKAVARSKAAAAVWISWVALVLMTTRSVASLRPSPTMAVYGLACVFLYLVPAIVFLLPTSLVAAELAPGWDGGVYNWVALGIWTPSPPSCKLSTICSRRSVLLMRLPPSVVTVTMSSIRTPNLPVR